MMVFFRRMKVEALCPLYVYKHGHRHITSSSLLRKGLYEIRTYVLKPESFPEYLATTGSDEFKCRLVASPLVGFFSQELGGLASTVIHIWRYDTLNHRTSVRKKLAANADFNAYMGKLRQMLVSQNTILAEPVGDVDLLKSNSNGDSHHMYSMETINETSIQEPGRVCDELSCIGVFKEIVGQANRHHVLYRAPTLESLRQVHTSKNSLFSNRHINMMTPTAFSPLM